MWREPIVKQMKWNSQKELEQLVIQLVKFESRTGTEGEKKFPEFLQNIMMDLPYFANNPTHIQLIDAKKGRQALSALYRTEKTANTIVLISHFDTVHTKEYGTLENIACDPYRLEQALFENKQDLSMEVQTDLQSGAYLFGRGTMDMKMGLALHLSIIEKATIEQWPINILLLSVPDEEVNSDGMRAAVEYIATLQKDPSPTFSLFLNSEPSFTQKPNDLSYYLYTGSIGKLMPTALSYGIETHAGEPLNGLNAHYMTSFITSAMEFNEQFQERVYGESTPLPTCLQVVDLKKDYSTQTSHHVAAYFNVQVMKQTAEDVMGKFERTVQQAIAKCEQSYHQLCERQNITPIGNINVMTYEQLYTYAIKKHGEANIRNFIQLEDKTMDDRTAVAMKVDRLMASCKELAPNVVLFFAPPYYPAVNSSNDDKIKKLVTIIQETMQEDFKKQVSQIHYFNGICDLSYVNYNVHDEGWKTYAINCPRWGNGYSIPFETMKQLHAPVLNVGPYGKDAHKLTERLHKQSAFIETPILLEKVIQQYFTVT